TLFREPRHPYTDALLNSIPARAIRAGVPLSSIPGAPAEPGHMPTGCRFAPRCPRAQEDCVTTDPALKGERPDHLFACLHPLSSNAVEIRSGSQQEGAAATHGAAPMRGRVDPAGVGVILQVENVRKQFQVAAGGLFSRRIGVVSAVADVSFDVERG